MNRLRATLAWLLLVVAGCTPLAAPPTATPPVIVELPTLTARPDASASSTEVPAPSRVTPTVALSPTAPDGSAQMALLHPDTPAPDPVTLPRYEIRATLDATHLSGTIALTVPNPDPEPMKDVVLRLYANAPTIYTGSRMQVASIRGANGPLQATVEADGTALRIALSAPVPSGESARLQLHFFLTIPDGEPRGYGIQQRANQRSIFGSPFPLLALRQGGAWQVPPVPTVGDAVSSPTALWDVWLTVPGDGQLVSTGQVVRQEGNELHLLSGPARDMALAWLPEQPAPITRMVEGVTLRFWPASLRRETLSAAEVAEIAAQIVAAHRAEFGPPPYAELDVVEAYVRVGGYEYPGLVLLDSRQRQDGTRDAIEFLLAHEIAHQWFYALVGNDVTAEPWLDESAATYAHLRYLAVTRGEQAAADQRAAWEREYADALARQPVGVNRDLYGYDSWATYRGPTYYGGAILLDELRLRLGDDGFRRVVDALLSKHAFGELTTADLSAAFDAEAARQGIEISDLWEQWLEPPAPATATPRATPALR